LQLEVDRSARRNRRNRDVFRAHAFRGLDDAAIHIEGFNDQGINSYGDTEARNVLLDGRINRGGDAARDGIVDMVPWGVEWITNKDAEKCCFP
jgi:hypothetical protein